VNEATARLLWPGREALGRCMQFMKPESPCHTVVGVVENARRSSVIETAEPHFYVPIDHPAAGSFGASVLVVRAGAVAAATREMRTVLREAFPSAEPTVTPMAQNLEPEYRPWRLGATLFTAFGLLALVVAIVGIYSTVSYGVSQRTHEFGVRIALGARIGDVLRQVVGEGLRTVAIGVVLGVVLALAAGRLVAALLYGVSPSDPLVLLLVPLVLLAVAALAAVVPAWRAARVDPVTALRSE
jgi:putative ABC transport system permease protein